MDDYAMGQFFRLTTIGEASGEQWVQNFFYRTPDSYVGYLQAARLISATGLANGGAGIGAALVAVLNTSTKITSVICRNLLEPRDFVVSTASLTGGVGGTDYASSFLAFKMTSTRSRSDIRASTRSIPVGTEAQIEGSGQIAASVLAALATLGNAMASVLNTVDDDNNPIAMSPVTIKRVEYESPSGKRAYRLPATEAALDASYSVIIGYSVDQFITTQNSRKRGRGA